MKHKRRSHTFSFSNSALVDSMSSRLASLELAKNQVSFAFLSSLTTVSIPLPTKPVPPVTKTTMGLSPDETRDDILSCMCMWGEIEQWKYRTIEAAEGNDQKVEITTETRQSEKRDLPIDQ